MQRRSTTLSKEEKTSFLEPVFIGGECQIDEGFWHPARQKIAGILDVFQDFLTRQGGKSPGQMAFNACEYRFLIWNQYVNADCLRRYGQRS